MDGSVTKSPEQVLRPGSARTRGPGGPRAACRAGPEDAALRPQVPAGRLVGGVVGG